MANSAFGTPNNSANTVYIISQSAVNLNGTINTDLYTLPIPTGITKYIIDQINLSNPSTNITSSTASITIRNASGGGGDNLNTLSFAGLTASTKFNKASLSGTSTTDTQTSSNLYVRMGGTNNGGAATVDLSIYIRKIS